MVLKEGGNGMKIPKKKKKKKRAASKDTQDVEASHYDA